MSGSDASEYAKNARSALSSSSITEIVCAEHQALSRAAFAPCRSFLVLQVFRQMGDKEDMSEWWDENQSWIFGIGLFGGVAFMVLGMVAVVVREYQNVPIVCRELRHCLNQNADCAVLQRACAEANK